jgi:excisionase family DNA binding protein
MRWVPLVVALVLTVDEAAMLLTVGRTTVDDLLKTGRLDGITIGRLRGGDRLHRVRRLVAPWPGRPMIFQDPGEEHLRVHLV